MDQASNISSPSPSPSPSTPDIDGTVGLLFIGTMISAVLYGVTSHQVYRYYALYPRDVWWYRALVPSLFVLATSHTALTADSYYYYLVTSYGDPARLIHHRMSLKLSIFALTATLVLCQAFYASRIYLFGARHFRHFAFTTVIFPLAIMLALAETGFALAVAGEALKSSSILVLASYSWIISATYGCAFAVDALITGTMIYILLRSRTGFSKTDNTLKSMVSYSVNTGLITSVVGIVVLITAATSPKTYAGVAMSFVSQRLYCNMVLSVLNSRRSLAQSLKYGTTIEMHTIGTQAGGNVLQCATSGPIEAAEVPVVISLTSDRRENSEVRRAPGDADSERTKIQTDA